MNDLQYFEFMCLLIQNSINQKEYEKNEAK